MSPGWEVELSKNPNATWPPDSFILFGLDPTRHLTMTTDFWHTDLTLADESSPLTLSLGSYILGSPGLLVGFLVEKTNTKLSLPAAWCLSIVDGSYITRPTP